MWLADPTQIRYVNGDMYVFFFPDAPDVVSMRAHIGGFKCNNAFVGLGGWDRPVKFLSTQVSVIAHGTRAVYGTHARSRIARVSNEHVPSRWIGMWVVSEPEVHDVAPNVCCRRNKQVFSHCPCLPASLSMSLRPRATTTST